MMPKPEEIMDLKGLEIPPDEFFYYLGEFPKNRVNFALVKVGGDCFDNPEPMYEALATLCKLSFYPVVIHGGGKQLDEAMARAGIVPEKKNGIRVTEKDALENIIAPELADINSKLVAGIQEYGGSAVGLTIEKIIAAIKKPEEDGVGYVGDVTGINIGPLEQAVANGQIPVVWCLGYEGDQLLNVNADKVAIAMAKQIEFAKFVMLTSVAGILDETRNIIPQMHYTKLGQVKTTGGMQVKADCCVEYLSSIQRLAASQITSPNNLLQELFTLKGKGTLIHNSDLAYSYHTSFDGLNKPQLKALLESALGSGLAPNYFEHANPCAVLLCTNPRGDYVGVFILQDQNAVSGAGYIDKMVIAPPYQGNHVGSNLMAMAKEKYNKLFWRADPAKHEKNGHFHTKYGEFLGLWFGWNHYHVGLTRREQTKAIYYAGDKPKTI